MKNIAKELILELLDSKKPSEYLKYLKSTNKLSLFPELLYLTVTPQDNHWHPEGTVWEHTLLVVDVAAEIRSKYTTESDAIAYMFGTLCHDFGKPYSTIIKDGKIKSPMHDFLGVPPTISFLNKIGAGNFAEVVCAYVLEHLKPMQLYKNRQNVSDAAIIRLSKRVNIYDLYNIGVADHWGRTDEEAIKRIYPAGDWLIERYEQILASKHLSELSA